MPRREILTEDLIRKILRYRELVSLARKAAALDAIAVAHERFFIVLTSGQKKRLSRPVLNDLFTYGGWKDKPIVDKSGKPYTASELVLDVCASINIDKVSPELTSAHGELGEVLAAIEKMRWPGVNAARQLRARVVEPAVHWLLSCLDNTRPQLAKDIKDARLTSGQEALGYADEVVLRLETNPNSRPVEVELINVRGPEPLGELAEPSGWLNHQKLLLERTSSAKSGSVARRIHIVNRSLVYPVGSSKDAMRTNIKERRNLLALMVAEWLCGIRSRAVYVTDDDFAKSKSEPWIEYGSHRAYLLDSATFYCGIGSYHVIFTTRRPYMLAGGTEEFCDLRPNTFEAYWILRRNFFALWHLFVDRHHHIEDLHTSLSRFKGDPPDQCDKCKIAMEAAFCFQCALDLLPQTPKFEGLRGAYRSNRSSLIGKIETALSEAATDHNARGLIDALAKIRDSSKATEISPPERIKAKSSQPGTHR